MSAVFKLINSPRVQFNQYSAVKYKISDGEWRILLHPGVTTIVIYVVKSDGTQIDGSTLSVSLIAAVKLLSGQGKTFSILYY